MTRYAAQILFGVISVVAFAGVLHVQEFSQNSPRFCESCHNVAPEITLWLESEHRDVRCQSCHHTTLEDGLRILIATVTGQVADTEHGHVAVASCEQCHAHHDSRWPDIADSAGHRVHAFEQKVECVECHGRQMHFGRPARSTCLHCHEGRDRGLAHEANHCLACHSFLSTEQSHFVPGRRECLHCHQTQARPIVISNTAPMRFVCSSCHKPHEGDVMTPCSECHPQDELFGLHSASGHKGGAETADCVACHAPHMWESGDHPCGKCHPTMGEHHAGGRCTGCHTFEWDGRGRHPGRESVGSRDKADP